MLDILDQKTAKGLGVDKVFRMLDFCSPYGRALRRLPVFGRKDVAALQARYDQIEKVLHFIQRSPSGVMSVENHLRSFKNIKNTLNRIENLEGVSTTELFEIKNTAIGMINLHEYLESQMNWSGLIGEYIIKPPLEVQKILDPNGEGTASFHIYSSYSKNLAQVRRKISALPDSEDKTALYIEEKKLESEIRLQLSQRLAEYTGVLRQNISCIESVDLLFALANLAADQGLVKPVICCSEPCDAGGDSEACDAGGDNEVGNPSGPSGPSGPSKCSEAAPVIHGAWHIDTAQTLKNQGRTFTRLDMEMGDLNIITGANMGGKSVALRTMGQVIALAQMGMFVPAASLEFCPFDSFLLAGEDDQSTDSGLSTFGAEIVRIKRATENKGSQLVLMDEIGRGTNPREGAALAAAILEFLKESGSKLLVTTHYESILEIKGATHFQVAGLKIGQIEEELKSGGEGLDQLHQKMDYSLVKKSDVKTVPSEAIRVAELLGLDPVIIKKAKDLTAKGR